MTPKAAELLGRCICELKEAMINYIHKQEKNGNEIIVISWHEFGETGGYWDV